ncbi:cation:proton antiporter domain-containing protein [Candidatus Cytomitobacter primus]|nr:cation:proton antiporter [Candidatus Cytomitobacter primus]
MGFAEINQIAIVLTACTLMSLLFIKMKQPPILGYIFAGVILGPYTLKWIKNPEVIRIIGDYGMLIMLFTVGLKLNVYEFRKVWKTAIACVSIQTIFGLLISLLISCFFVLDAATIALITCMMALSSTAIAIKIMESSNEINTPVKSLVVSILIAQDLTLAPMIMILKSLIFNHSMHSLFIKIIISIASMIGTVMFLSKAQLKIVHKFFNSWVFKNAEINALISVTSCFGFAAISEYLGLSGVYGAFLCGFILGNAGPKNLLLAFSAPLSGMMMMSFFIYIGILFDIVFIMHNIISICLIVCVITMIKLLINTSSLKILGWKDRVALESSVLLSQISEFSFVLINIYSFHKNSIYLTNWIISTTVISLSAGALFIVMFKNMMDQA